MVYLLAAKRARGRSGSTRERGGTPDTHLELFVLAVCSLGTRAVVLVLRNEAHEENTCRGHATIDRAIRSVGSTHRI